MMWEELYADPTLLFSCSSV